MVSCVSVVFDGLSHVYVAVRKNSPAISILGTSRSWWWLLGFPIWYGIAYNGMQGMQKLISEENHETCFQLHDVTAANAGPSQEENGEALPDPQGFDYLVAIVFIIFGVVALVAGLTSNIWGIVNGI